MRHDHTLHRNLVFRMKVTEIHRRILSWKVMHLWNAFSSRVDNATEEEHRQDLLRQVRKLSSIKIRNHEHLLQGSGSRDGNLRTIRQREGEKKKSITIE